MDDPNWDNSDMKPTWSHLFNFSFHFHTVTVIDNNNAGFDSICSRPILYG